jgi:hypothetical protein
MQHLITSVSLLSIASFSSSDAPSVTKISFANLIFLYFFKKKRRKSDKQSVKIDVSECQMKNVKKCYFFTLASLSFIAI